MNSKPELQHLLYIAGYIDMTLVTNTLQGSIHHVTSTQSEHNPYTIKVTDKTLQEQSIVYIEGTTYRTQQSITKEASILKYLSSSNQPSPPLIKYKDFFYDKYNYYLVTEDIGDSMFNIVNKCHSLIKSKHLDINEWHKFCRIAMKQMVDVLEWMHNTMHCCHLNVSLENFYIKNMNIIVTPSTKKIRICSDFKVKICNFGLAEVFDLQNDDGEIDFLCNKYVGKTSYKAPKVFAELTVFDARMADCWSLAVCFFMMFTGNAPFQRASPADPLFNYIMNDQMIDVFKSWGITRYVTPQICHLLCSLFVVEKDRLTITDIKKHCWLNP